MLWFKDWLSRKKIGSLFLCQSAITHMKHHNEEHQLASKEGPWVHFKSRPTVKKIKPLFTWSTLQWSLNNWSFTSAKPFIFCKNSEIGHPSITYIEKKGREVDEIKNLIPGFHMKGNKSKFHSTFSYHKQTNLEPYN